MSEKPIGKVTATESKPTSCGAVRFWTRRDVVIRPFDIVRIKHLKDSYSYALVTDLQYMTDSAGHLTNYVSSDFGDVEAEPFNKRMGATIGEADVLYNTSGIEMPIRDGAAVEWADAEGVREALGLGAVHRPVPAGYISNSNGLDIPIEFEADYLLGPEGAHLNIAGISGLATKTTYAMFLLSSIQQRLGEPVKIVIFNVKGNDLLSIDEHPEQGLGKRQLQEWEKCGLEAKPFENVTYLYPFANSERVGYTQSMISESRLARQLGEDRAFNYYFDVETAKPKLGLLFSDIDDPTDSLASILTILREFKSVSWQGFRSDASQYTVKGGVRKGNISVQSWRKFSRLLHTRTQNDIFTERAQVNTEKKRHKLIREALREMKPGGVLVIDIAQLPGFLQAFVFGDVIETIYGAKMGEEEDFSGEEPFGKVIVFADELNKYAPKVSGKSKVLTGSLLEVSERGRSLGVVLFGAEQFRSGVHERVLGNCSTNVFGRTSPVEVERCADYRYFPKTYKWTVQRLEKGQLLLQHAIFRTSLVKVRFPHPAYFQPKG